MPLFTIGHSNHKIEAFIALLQQHRITAVADVRSYPYSRFLAHFNQIALKAALAKQGIYYVFLGKELGARPNNQACYVDGKARYEKIAETDEFHQGIQRVLTGLRKYRIVLMCAEQDPLTCHRAILICQHLRRHPDLEIHHILKNGELEPHRHLEKRMLEKYDLATEQLSLFSQALPTKRKSLEEAYELQGNKIAYVEKKDDAYEQAN